MHAAESAVRWPPQAARRRAGTAKHVSWSLLTPGCENEREIGSIGRTRRRRARRPAFITQFNKLPNCHIFLFAHQMIDVLVVLLADVLDQLTAQQRWLGRECPRTRERLGVVDD